MNRSESKKSKSSKSVKVKVKVEPGTKKRKSDRHSPSGKSKEKKRSHHHHSSTSSSPSKSSSTSLKSSPSKPTSSPFSSIKIKEEVTETKPSPSSHFLSSLLPPPQLQPPAPSSSSVSSRSSSYSSSPSSSTISSAYSNKIVNNFSKPKVSPIGFGSKVMTRSKVYSGTVRAHATYDDVPKLEKLCLQVLMDNYTNITYLGDAPYWLIKPVLEKCTSNQLFLLEDYNPRLTEDDDELWKWHCEKEFRDWKRQEDETWRDLFVRAEQERKRKLETITRSIDKKEKDRGPMRKTQLTFTEPKPPRNMRRKIDKQDKGFVKAVAPPSVSSNAPGATSTPINPTKKTKGILMKNARKMMLTIRRQY